MEMSEGGTPIELTELMKQVEELHSYCFSWALHCSSGDRWEAEEVLQTVYLKILDGRARFAGRSSVKTWLFSVIRSTSNETRRTMWRRIRGVGRWLAMRPDADNQFATRDLYEGELKERIAGLMGGLSRRQREVLRLVFYHDLTVEQAAEVMGLSLGTARVHYERGKASLRRQWEGQNDRARRRKDQAALL